MVGLINFKLVKSQLDKISDLSLGLGQLLFGSTVLPYIIPSIDRPSFQALILGLIIAIFLWVFAILLVGKIKILILINQQSVIFFFI